MGGGPRGSGHPRRQGRPARPRQPPEVPKARAGPPLPNPDDELSLGLDVEPEHWPGRPRQRLLLTRATPDSHCQLMTFRGVCRRCWLRLGRSSANSVAPTTSHHHPTTPTTPAAAPRRRLATDAGGGDLDDGLRWPLRANESSRNARSETSVEVDVLLAPTPYPRLILTLSPLVNLDAPAPRRLSPTSRANSPVISTEHLVNFPRRYLSSTRLLITGATFHLTPSTRIP
jgi:hypothetical protein